MNITYYLLGYAAIVIVAFIGLSVWFDRYHKEKKLSAAVIFNSFWAIVAGGFLLISILAMAKDDPKKLVQAFLASLVGAGLGWLLGIYISPLGASEATAFQRYGTALAGVLSGYSLKWVSDNIGSHQSLLLAHWLSIASFCISALLAMAAVYNTRAYDNKLLEVHLSGDKPSMSNGKIKVKLSTSTTFYARVVGPNDPTVKWHIVPNAGTPPTVDDHGVITTLATAATCRLIATNLEDPTLSNFVDLEIA